MAVAALAAAALAPGSAEGASLFADDGDGLEPGLPVAYAPAGGPVTVDVQALHPDLAQGAVGRIHRDSAAHLGLVRARFVGPGGSTLGRPRRPGHGTRCAWASKAAVGLAPRSRQSVVVTRGE